MTPALTPELSILPVTDLATAPAIDAGREINIIAALLEALNGSERYQLSERGGELYIEAADQPRH
jgi:hypothetical protein